MQIDIACFATLARYAPPANPFDVKENLNLGELIATLGIPDGAVKIAFVNGRHAEPDRVLQPGDRVGLFPPVAGG